MKNNKLRFQVPVKKMYRMIVDTDAKNEADDQFAIAHHLMTPMFDVKGIIATHFEHRDGPAYNSRTTMQQSYDEIQLVLKLMGLTEEYPVYKGCVKPLDDETHFVESEGARFIVEEAMKDDPMPLVIGLQGAITNLASALLMEPRIADRIIAVWIGGDEYPKGGMEFNLNQDINAANVVFSSKVQLWQVPKNVYKMMNISLAELQARVAPCGEIGEYLFRQMVELNDACGDRPWPHGETWCIGDQPTVGVFLEDRERRHYTIRKAPRVRPDCTYEECPTNRDIRVYHAIDARLVLEDFYAKLQINYGK